MKILYTTLLLLCTQFIFAQQESEISLYEKHGNLVAEVLVYLPETASIFSAEEHCAAGVSPSFCLRNYLQELMSVTINNQAKSTFIIDASISDEKKIQVILSTPIDGDLTQLTIQTDAFFAQFPDFKHLLKIRVNNKTEKLVLDTNKRSYSVSF